MLGRKFKCVLVVIVVFYATVTFNLVTWVLISDSHPHPLVNSEDTLLGVYKKQLQLNEVPLRHARHYLQVHRKENGLPGKPYRHDDATGQVADQSRVGTFKNLGNISILSGYFDDRVTPPVVRVIAAAELGTNEKLVCGYHSDTAGPWFLASVYEMCENHGKEYGGYIFTCTIPQTITTTPEKVYLKSLTSLGEPVDRDSNESVALDINLVKHSIPVQDGKHSNPTLHAARPNNTPVPNHLTLDNIPGNKKRLSTSNITSKGLLNSETSADKSVMKIAVCVPPLFGNIKLSPFIQFIELAKLQGVSHFTFYKMAVSKNAETLLDFYKKRGEATVIDWELPARMRGGKLWYHGQLLSIQDCLYRNMGQYSHIAFLDLDEVIVPQQTFTWQEMLETLDQAHNSTTTEVSGYSFQSAFFDPNQQVDSKHQLSLLQLLKRNKALSSVRQKLIVKSRHVVEMGIHHISKTVAGYQNESTLDVATSLALVHHYQPCNTRFDKRMMCREPTVTDTAVLKYAEPLKQRYVKVLLQTLSGLR